MNQNCARALVVLDIGSSRVPETLLRPEDFAADQRKGTVVIGHPFVDVYLVGEPGQLRRWANQVKALADEMARPATDAKGGQ